MDVIEDSEIVKYRYYSYKAKQQVHRVAQKVTSLVGQIGFTEAFCEYEGKEYRICYKEEDAIAEGIQFVSCYALNLDKLEYPCYVQFEDKYVALCVDWFSSQLGDYIVTFMGFRLINSRVNKGHKPYFDINNKPATLGYRDRQSVRHKRDMIANLMAHNCNLEQICAYFKHDKSSFKRSNIKRLMATKKVKEMATEQVKEVMKNMGITPETILKEFQFLVKTAKEMAIERNNPVALKVMGETLANLANYIGFNDKDTTTEKRTLELVDYHEDMKELTSETQKIKMIEEREV